ncbi:MAG TPA: 5-deoxy-glucuronate isomerase, partial [Vitreimonas sp.]|nr:5-deoxy-glucuronate isomerase [Vitreimonas sp.]
MPNLRVRPKQRDASGAVLEVTPRSAGWTYVGFKVLKLEPGEKTSGGEAGREACLVVLTGRCDVETGGQRFENIGGRMSVFEDASPAAVYAPA